MLSFWVNVHIDVKKNMGKVVWNMIYIHGE
jgi:hypothetical protein